MVIAVESPDLNPIERVRVVDVDVCVTRLQTAIDRVIAWSSLRRGRYATLTNVHMVMEAHDSVSFRDVVNRADLVLPDGMPVVWAQRALGRRGAARVPGPEFTAHLLGEAERADVPVAFYGGAQETVDRLVSEAQRRWPKLRVVCALSPPFRPLTEAEDADLTSRIVGSGARIVFVSLGCPKQEVWMAEHVDRIPAVLAGVGQAFEIVAGIKRDAPRWMQRLGLGWAFRLLQEPRRLWRRYAVHNPRYIAAVARQLLRSRARGEG